MVKFVEKTFRVGVALRHSIDNCNKMLPLLYPENKKNKKTKPT